MQNQRFGAIGASDECFGSNNLVSSKDYEYVHWDPKLNENGKIPTSK